MPSKKKDSKSLKQTTLFDSSKLSKRNPKQHSSPSVSSKAIKKLSATSTHSSDTHFRPLTVVSSDEEDVASPSRLTRKRRLTRLASESPSEESNPPAQDSTSQIDSDIEDLVPRKRRRLQRRRSSEGGVADVAEDTDRLGDEVDEEDILDSRLRIRNKKTSYQENLEKLKRRKLKTNISSEDEDTPDEWVDNEDSSTPFKGGKPSSEANNPEDEEPGSNESSDFIVEDDNVFQLPAQFSMETHQDLSHQFIKIFQFFVHIAVRPLKKRSSFMKEKLNDEEYFSAPLRIMQRKLLGIRDSLVASSVWRPIFKKGLERYPDFELTLLDFAVPTCDACHMGGRKSTVIGRLTGSQYNSSGFDPLTSDDDSDEGVEYHLGRFCARRAKVYHKFSHWEYELFQIISRELEELRSSVDGRGFHRIAYFHGTEPPDDLTDADALCEWLKQRQIIDREWQNLETLMESAHHLEMHRKDGEDD